ncbi:tetratricopeptide repeat protein [Actinomadura sp. WMMB 499]|uniref:tetratricopeptide repeat protein n=1 Tax=Actinomadura sp. WMMB 499 TaxID=1219491 RepID=UPI001248230D|nr:tetratricopeptide repeat protein [Actinomadura sp. WMMB 499]QFG24820.1 tetratricopeptide repeat protein [Actinomadura sp. WMMB 499]
MRADFEDSYRELEPAAARLLRLLALHPADGIGLPAAAVLADRPEDETLDRLEALAGRGLVTDAGGGRYTLPGPVRVRAAEHAEAEDDPDERDAALRRVLDHYLSAAPGTGLEEQGLALLDRERRAEAVETLEEALEEALRDAGRGGDHRTVLIARHNLGRALTAAGALDRAMRLLGPLPEEFAALPEPDDRNRGRALLGLGEAYLRARRPVAAVNFFGQALEIMRTLDAPDLQADAYAHLAEAARQRGDETAERTARDAAAALRARAGERAGERAGGEVRPSRGPS